MPVPTFLWQRTWLIDGWRMGGRNMPTLIFFWLTVAFRLNTETNSCTYMSLENVMKVVSELCVARTPSKGTTNGCNLLTSTVQ